MTTRAGKFPSHDHEPHICICILHSPFPDASHLRAKKNTWASHSLILPTRASQSLLFL